MLEDIFDNLDHDILWRLERACSILNFPTTGERPRYAVFVKQYFERQYNEVRERAYQETSSLELEELIAQMTNIAEAYIYIHRVVYKEVTRTIDPNYALHLNRHSIEAVRSAYKKARRSDEELIELFRQELETL